MLYKINISAGRLAWGGGGIGERRRGGNRKKRSVLWWVGGSTVIRRCFDRGSTEMAFYQWVRNRNKRHVLDSVNWLLIVGWILR